MTPLDPTAAEPPRDDGPGDREGDLQDDRTVEGLLAAALVHQAVGPVDADRLVAAAQAGARRIRRRRSYAAGALAAALIAVLPFALGRAAGSAVVTGGAGRSVAESTSQAPVPSAGSAPSSGVGEVPTGLPLSSTDAVLRFTGAIAVVPDDAVLQPSDLRSVALLRESDNPRLSASTVAPGPVCPDDGLAPGVAGAREVAYGTAEQAGDPDSRWRLVTLVQVIRGDGADRQLSRLDRELATCQGVPVTRVPVTGIAADAAILGYVVGDQSSRPQNAQAVIVLGAVRVGMTTAEVTLRVPPSIAADPATRLEVALSQGRRLLARAGYLLVASDLAGAARNSLS